jgi:hypothetical protein
MITSEEIGASRIELSIKIKNGVAFLIAGCILWGIIAFIWVFDIQLYIKCIIVFIIGGMISPIAFLVSKILKIPLEIRDNPISPLGSLIGLGTIFYLPLYIYTIIKIPEYYLIIISTVTGAHFFLYGWFYKTKLYTIFAGIMVIGVFILGILLKENMMVIVPLFMLISEFALAMLLYFDLRKKYREINEQKIKKTA